MDGRVLQLADSAFPAGAFAHSGGLESLRQLGFLQGEAALRTRLVELSWHVAWSSLPFLNDAHGGHATAADRALDRFLSSHVANRASRAQGGAFLIAAEATFQIERIATLRRELPCAHGAVAAGAALACAGLTLADVRMLFLYGAVRGALSACVRLGVVGPLRAQAILLGLHGEMADALEETRGLRGDEACGTAALLDTAQAAQDRLYSRLFQS